MVALILITQSPYGSDRAYHALRLAAALMGKAEVRVFLMSDGVYAALDGQSVAVEDQNLGKRIAHLAEAGAKVSVCGLCLETRGAHASALIAGVAMGSMVDLAGWVVEADRVLTF